jgi:NTP pyrophosphatase (non-canonical NTP hydrolase)
MSDPFTAADRETFNKAIGTWGVDAQAEMAEEEAAEFVVASKHWTRGKANREDVIDELADLRIMVEQMSLVLGQNQVDQRVQEKMDRLRERISEAQE